MTCGVSPKLLLKEKQNQSSQRKLPIHGTSATGASRLAVITCGLPTKLLESLLLSSERKLPFLETFATATPTPKLVGE